TREARPLSSQPSISVLPIHNEVAPPPHCGNTPIANRREDESVLRKRPGEPIARLGFVLENSGDARDTQREGSRPKQRWPTALLAGWFAAGRTVARGELRQALDLPLTSLPILSILISISLTRIQEATSRAMARSDPVSAKTPGYFGARRFALDVDKERVRNPEVARKALISSGETIFN